jgi:phosphoribosylformylglycinamidine synthase
VVFVLGLTRSELGGSEYFASKGFVGNEVPKISPDRSAALYRALQKAMVDGLVASCHDCSDGGLAVAMAETAFSGGLGMMVDLRRVPVEGVHRDDYLLFSESQSRFVVTVHPENRDAFQRALAAQISAEVGRVRGDDRFEVTGIKGGTIVRTTIQALKAAWRKPLA